MRSLFLFVQNSWKHGETHDTRPETTHDSDLKHGANQKRDAISSRQEQGYLERDGAPRAQAAEEPSRVGESRGSRGAVEGR